MSELDAMIAVSSVVAEEADPNNSVTLNDGTVVTIRKCQVRDTSQALRLIKVLFDSVGIKKLSDVGSLDLDNTNIILQLIAESYDPITALATELAGLEPNNFRTLDMDDGIKIILKAFEVNKRFFLNSVLPLVQGALPKS